MHHFVSIKDQEYYESCVHKQDILIGVLSTKIAEIEGKLYKYITGPVEDMVNPPLACESYHTPLELGYTKVGSRLGSNNLPHYDPPIVGSGIADIEK